VKVFCEKTFTYTPDPAVQNKKKYLYIFGIVMKFPYHMGNLYNLTSCSHISKFDPENSNVFGAEMNFLGLTDLEISRF
jgi:hypothetical protein